MLVKQKWFKKGCASFSLCLLVLAGADVIGNQITKNQENAEEMIKLGQCTLPDGSVATDITTQLRALRVNNEWVVSMDMFGVNSVGSWFVNFTKNGVGEPSMQYEFNPPGGWSIAGSQVEKGAVKGKYEFAAKATKRSDPIIVCDATIAITKY